MRPDQVISRGDSAAALLESTAFRDAVAGVKSDLFEQWVSTKDSEARENLWLRFHLVDAVTDKIRGFAAAGRAARAKLDEA